LIDKRLLPLGSECHENVMQMSARSIPFIYVVAGNGFYFCGVDKK